MCRCIYNFPGSLNHIPSLLNNTYYHLTTLMKYPTIYLYDLQEDNPADILKVEPRF